MRYRKKIDVMRLLPALGVIGWVAVILAVVLSGVWWLLMLPLMHIMLLALGSTLQRIRHKAQGIYVFLAYLCIHFGYGLGTIFGMIKKDDKVRERG